MVGESDPGREWVNVSPKEPKGDRGDRGGRTSRMGSSAACGGRRVTRLGIVKYCGWYLSEIGRREMAGNRGILGIENRTENWRTAQYFSPFLSNSSARSALANRLLKPHGESPITDTSEVKIELFWKGVRDYLHLIVADGNALADSFAEHYRELFPDLQALVQSFRSEKHPYYFALDWRTHHYDVSTDETKAALCENVSNTEIDVVLETPTHLFIGEAKHESGYGSNSKYMLVHQLIRQYVTARILSIHVSSTMDYPQKQVVVFLIGDETKLGSIKNTVQVKFILDQSWLHEDNILSWQDIEKLGQSPV